jgi:cytochrome c
MQKLRSHVVAAALLTSMTATALLSVAVNQAAAQKSPNPKLGYSLAKRLCSSCHIIAGEPRVDSMLVDAPSFASIANKPGQSIEGIAGHIVFPHAEMPRVKLTRDEIAALSTYILSLRGNTP